MKTVSPYIQHFPRLQTFYAKSGMPVMAATMRNIMALTWATLVAIAIITFSVWSVGTEISTYLGVSAWGLGFVFLALAIDNQGRRTLYQMVSGVALLILAMLQNSVAPEFVIASGAILASWVAGIVFRFLSIQTR